MKTMSAAMAAGLLFAICAHGGETPASQVRLISLGRYAVTTSAVPAATTVKVRVSHDPGFHNCGIVLAAFTESRVREGGTAGFDQLLKEWTAKDIKAQPVLVYQTTNATHIGIGLKGTVAEPDRDIPFTGDHHTVTFSAFFDKMVLDVKFVEPEF